MSEQQDLDRLCNLYGISLNYTDIWGTQHRVSPQTQRALLSTMGVRCDTPEALVEALDRREREARGRLIPPVLVVRQDAGRIEIPVRLPTSDLSRKVRWTLALEDGQTSSGECLHDGTTGLVLPTTPPEGYHQLAVEAQGQKATMDLIVVPGACYRPAAVRDDNRVWGPAVQLYTLRSQRNWGIGDFTDLRMVLEFCARIGAGIVGVNPLHALFPHNPEHASPYSPSSRLFLNILYIDVEAVPDYAECDAALAMVRDGAFQARLRALRAAEFIDYRAVSSTKLQVLELAYRHFREHHLAGASQRGLQFRTFQEERGRALRAHALFEALQEHFHGQDGNVWGWPAWPDDYHDPESDAVKTFAQEHEERVEFYEYLQWQAEIQLALAGRRSLELGLGVGIYADLAVSIDGGGAEAWANQHLYAVGARIGAPPDDFNLRGQDWGLPPLNPDLLQEAGYRPFIATLRENMRHAGALRIDHVMGLMRLFWVPAEGTPDEGTYVHYPLQDLLGIVALESQRNRCLVIGEDLGTVPDEVRQALNPMGILSYRPFYFEKTGEGAFKPPAAMEQEAIVAVSTHDLPTLAGYWQGVDLDIRTDLNLFPSDAMREAQIILRAEDRARLLVALEKEALLPSDMTVHPVSSPNMTPQLSRAVHAYLARSPARVMVFQPEDLLGQINQVNLPGTTDAYPNWRRKLTLNVEDFIDDPAIVAFAEAIREERGSAVHPARAVRLEGRPLVGAKIPRATYRFQFNGDFTFTDAAGLIPYLASLGVSHCYASPYLKARPGSMHGYDIIDHNALNPEIGGAAEFDQYVAALRKNGLGQVMDVVPNHMGVMGADNAWWLNVLENGQASVFASFFDIDWEPLKDELRGKVLVPVLGDHYGTVLERGELRLTFDAAHGEFSIFYYNHRFPVDPREYPRILQYNLERLTARLQEEDPQLLEFQSLITAFSHLPSKRESGARQVRERERDKEIHKRHLAGLCARCPDIIWFIEENVDLFNESAVDPTRPPLLHELIEKQAYRLAYWRVASDEINYRRFFDINDLAGLRMEREEVFDATHQYIMELLAQGKVDGLRIDHPDGLYDPATYFARLQAYYREYTAQLAEPGETEQSLYVIVEKILAGYERLPEPWQVHGTTGYDFANLVNGVFVDTRAADKLERIYSAFIGEHRNVDEILYQAKKLIMKVALASELNVLANQLARIASIERHTYDFTLNGLRDALMEIVACFPVYRSYISDGHVSPEDRRYVDWAVSVAKKRSQAADITVFDFVRDVLLGTLAEGKPAWIRERLAAFTMKFQQYTGPVMAKGMEDTTFYRYHRLISLNEVGGDPRRFGVSVAAFHHANQEQRRSWPHAMLASSTHDNKRSEDVRARINVLSELPSVWRLYLSRWARMNRSRKVVLDEERMPSRDDEYLLYQTLLGVWPLHDPDDDELEVLRQRVDAYMLKATREAKLHTSWINPNPDYENSVSEFVRALLAPTRSNRFLEDFRPFQKQIARYGMFNSLSQTLLKLTVPGVPDIYQGTEIWDFSLVDPDNRRPVDYRQRMALLDSLRKAPDEASARANWVRALLDTMEDGRVKLWTIHRVLNFRREHESLFRHGEYLPLRAGGDKEDHLCAFARTESDAKVMIIAPRLFATLLEGGDALPLGPEVWGDTWLELPSEDWPGKWTNILTGERIDTRLTDGTARVLLAEVLRDFPIAALAAT